jgi:hypothetical protein
MERHAKAIEAAIASGKSRLSDDQAPLIELIRVLADQMDAAGTDGPSSRLAAAYLSALKDLSRSLSSITPRMEGTGKLAQLRRDRQIQRPKASA